MEAADSVIRYKQIKSFSKIADLLDPAIFTLITGVGINFFRFLRSRGISAGENLVVLSSKDHYSYDREELKNVRILINLRKLNLIKHLDIFLGALVRILPPNTSFIGYFSDERSDKASAFHFGRIMQPFRKLFRWIDSGTSHRMNRDEVMDLLWKNGFKTIAMKEIRRDTYFISQSIDSI
jgi:hypothetical protein